MASEFLLATRSRDKAAEIVEILSNAVSAKLVTLADLHVEPNRAEDDVESFPTFIQNATAKARYFAQSTGRATLADDSGLMVDALSGKPGVRTKRFAIDHGYHGAGGRDLDEANNDLLLEKLAAVTEPERSAHYICAAALAWPNGDAITALGTCSGMITRERSGTAGFGYDPLFYLPELGLTFAQLTRAQKNQISHRALAFRALAPHVR